MSGHQQFDLQEKTRYWSKSTLQNDSMLRPACSRRTQLHRSVCVVRGNVVCVARSGHVTGVAEEMRVQREALRAGLIRELLTTLLGGGGADKDRNAHRKWGQTSRHFITQVRMETGTKCATKIPYLAVVALKVIILVHRHDPEDLFTALRRKTTLSICSHLTKKCEPQQRNAR